MDNEQTKKHIVHNIDGEEIDLLEDNLAEKLTYESANFIRRLGAFIVDTLIVIVVWYLSMKIFKIFNSIDSFMESFQALDEELASLEKLNELKDLVWKLFFNLTLAWLGSNALYFTIVPAIIGDGRTLGKLCAGIGVVHANTLEEVSPTRLVFREIVCRCLLEYLLVIPLIISVFMSFFRKDSKSLHDILSKTVVIKLDLYGIE